jgi:Carboxypeptidase regulatory-like domain
MFLHRIPRRTPVHRVAGWLRAASAALVVLVLVACGDSSGPGGGGGASATLEGTVRTPGAAGIVEGAIISVGAREATSDASGHFELAGLPVGAATVQARRAGYLPAQATVTINAGANTHDFTLTEQEIYTSGSASVYVPAGVGPLRGAIVTLGGPNTSGFVTGGVIVGPSSPDLEQSLQALGANLRALAQTAHVALLGSATIAMADNASSDEAIFDALQNVAAQSGHDEIATTPVLMVGLSAGAHEAAGLASRNPLRTIGLLARVPVSVTRLTEPAALAVPAFVMQAEIDHNLEAKEAFSENRSRGGLWSLAVEPAVEHGQATSLANSVMTGWITAALGLRLPASSSAPLVSLAEASGWLGDQSTLEIAPWATFPGNPRTASWLLSPSVAASWKVLGTPVGGPS